MKMLLKLGAAAALIAAFAGASAGETIEEIVVIGQRPSWALPRIELERPAKPQIDVEPELKEPVAPEITLPAFEIAGLERRLG